MNTSEIIKKQFAALASAEEFLVTFIGTHPNTVSADANLVLEEIKEAIKISKEHNTSKESTLFKVIFRTEFNQIEIKETKIIPRLGDTLPMFYKPYPSVYKIILFPDMNELRNLDYEKFNEIDAIVFVK